MRHDVTNTLTAAAAAAAAAVHILFALSSHNAYLTERGEREDGEASDGRKEAASLLKCQYAKPQLLIQRRERGGRASD